VDIAEVLRDAALGDLRTLHEPAFDYDSLYRATVDLFDLIEQREVPFVLVGGLAMLQYVGGRNTRDIDLIMALADLKRLPELVVESQDGDFVRANYRGVQVDLLLTSNQLFDTVMREYVTLRDFSGRTLPVATPEGLVLLKLFALPSLYRQGDASRIGIYENDVYALMESEPIELDAIFARLAPCVLASDLTAIREIVNDIRGRITRLEGGGGFAPG
jgi:hypothetical protein